MDETESLAMTAATAEAQAEVAKEKAEEAKDAADDAKTTAEATDQDLSRHAESDYREHDEILARLNEAEARLAAVEWQMVEEVLEEDDTEEAPDNAEAMGSKEGSDQTGESEGTTIVPADEETRSTGAEAKTETKPKRSRLDRFFGF